MIVGDVGAVVADGSYNPRMDENPYKAPSTAMKFSIRDLLLVTVIAAIGLGWWLDHRETNDVVAHAERLHRTLKHAKAAYEQSSDNFDRLMKRENARPDPPQRRPSFFWTPPQPPDWKIIDEPIEKP